MLEVTSFSLLILLSVLLHFRGGYAFVLSTETLSPAVKGPPDPSSNRPFIDSSSNDFERSIDGLRRAQEVGSVLINEVFVPLISSIAIEEKSLADWDGFWSRQQGETSNAGRISMALERLGPTYVKFGQALSARLDLIPPPLAEALARLQDSMEPFDDVLAHDIIRKELDNTGILSAKELDIFFERLSTEAVAAASIGQVYKGELPGRGRVAVKVQRPGVRGTVEQDAAMLRQVAQLIESLPGLPNVNESSERRTRLVSTKVVAAVDEFMTRIFEELDYHNEASNMEAFFQLYSIQKGSSKTVKVVVPAVHLDLCTDKLLVMEWIDGTKLSNASKTDIATVAENLSIIESGIAATLSQLLETGIMHADPHPGNLLKVQTKKGVELGFLDFGMLSTIPESVRDALVCAVAQVVFARDTDAVAALFGELQLLPADILDDEDERRALSDALERVFNDVLQYPTEESSTGTSAIPILRFDKLLGGLSLLVSRFQFTLPPYFLNIARALATLEGLAREMDPSFNALQAVYPYALKRILKNPSKSTIVEETLVGLMYDQERRRFDTTKIKSIIRDAAVLGGWSKRRVIFMVIRSTSGRSIAKKILRTGVV